MKNIIEHKEKERVRHRKYNIEHQEEEKKRKHDYHAKNREKLNKQHRKYRLNHLKEEKERHYNYYSKHKENIHKYYSEHQEIMNEKNRNYRIENPEYFRITSQNRRARISKNGGNITAQDWYNILEQSGHKCLKCGSIEKLTLDHIIPIAKNGRNDKNNAQVLCKSCNSSKHTKIIDYRPLALFNQIIMEI